jgi:hypothetical protein
MSNAKLNRAIEEARRFLTIATDYQNALHNEEVKVAKAKKAEPDNAWKHWHQSFPAKSGATRRASMDLTRVLADLRKPGA